MLKHPNWQWTRGHAGDTDDKIKTCGLMTWKHINLPSVQINKPFCFPIWSVYSLEIIINVIGLLYKCQ